MPLKLTLIFLGAGLGGDARYTLGGWVQAGAGSQFPLPTLVINILGCLAIGFLFPVLTGTVLVDEKYRLGIIVGILGGFTTFSAFGYETFQLAYHRQDLLAGLNILLSNVLGLAGVCLVIYLALRRYGAGSE